MRRGRGRGDGGGDSVGGEAMQVDILSETL